MDESHVPALNQETPMSNGFRNLYWKGLLIFAFGSLIYIFRRRIFRFQNPKTVQIFIPVRTPTTEKFHSAISILCQTFSYNCNFCYDIGGLIEEVPLIAVCPISSRFEPDIDFAIYGIQRQKPFAVLLLHTGLESSLPRLPTASKLAHKEKYKKIEFIDIAYNMDANLYQCEMNKRARNKLHLFLHKKGL